MWISLGQYRIKCLVERAGSLLWNSERKINDIARELGFDDEAYFCRILKKRANLPRLSTGVYGGGEGREMGHRNFVVRIVITGY